MAIRQTIDSLNRSTKFSLGNSTYCVTINDTGSFVTTGPNSPENGLPLVAGITGVINGGYVTDAFTTALISSPTYTTHGNLGSFGAMRTTPSFLSYFDNPGAFS